MNPPSMIGGPKQSLERMVHTKKGLNSLIILGAWTIWNHRNRCVFDGTPPSLAGALLLASEEQRFWKLAKAQGSSFPSLEPVDSQ